MSFFQMLPHPVLGAADVVSCLDLWLIWLKCQTLVGPESSQPVGT